MSRFPEQHLYTGGQDPFLPALLRAINYATHIDITTAFIRQTGLALLTEALEDALHRHVQLRILTGDYLYITDPAALRSLMLLQQMGAEVRVFESNNTHSFHMKAYIFRKGQNEGIQEGCAFVGSSNISKSALQTGLEWNLRVNQAENPVRFEVIGRAFEHIFSNKSCKILTHTWIDNYSAHRPQESAIPVIEAGADEQLPPPEPNGIQALALAALQTSRQAGYRRGLVVMATGLGKTWLAAFDTQEVNAKRVLFVAHREEILDQAERTFVRIRPDEKTGRYTGKKRQLNVDMLFASIQTLGRLQHLKKFPSSHFDYIIVDEFHHAAARTYQKLLSHFKPRFLLGLTATPDRTDQAEILNFCDDNLVYSCGLFDGINAELLVPFNYYGIGDATINYQEIAWRNGKFDPTQLVNQLATHARALHNFKEWRKKGQSRTLAFCVSKRHADFMTEFFNRKGAKSVAVYSGSTVLRNEALDQLRAGTIDVLFSVDLFNEGIDLPSIDTVLMLRPTESKILFLQQLGRGLRISKDTSKTKLVVIDFIGNHISFFRKAEALFKIGISTSDRKEFLALAEKKEICLPPGCFVNYDLVAIDFMKALITQKIDVQEDRYTALKDAMGRRPSLSEFYLAGGLVNIIRAEYGQWFKFIAQQGDLSREEEHALEANKEFYKELEQTRLTKSFKLVLLEAMLENDGFKEGINTRELAKESFEVLHRRRNLLADLPKIFSANHALDENEKELFHKYWLRNPVNAWTGGNTKNGQPFFEIQGGLFRYKNDLPSECYDAFTLLVQETVGYRLLQYEQRIKQSADDVTAEFGDRTENKDAISLPFFSDLRIACGHFATSRHETDHIETRTLPSTYGRLNTSRHFIARAKGNSMNGGRTPIKDGDYLLLELITPVSAGSNSNRVIAIEQQDTSGDDQYLLRYVNKLAPGKYQLQAFNPAYEAMMATEDMRTFARFIKVINPEDMVLH